jgi:tetratricopeptide (TPR) repeat protein
MGGDVDMTKRLWRASLANAPGGPNSATPDRIWIVRSAVRSEILVAILVAAIVAGPVGCGDWDSPQLQSSHSNESEGPVESAPPPPSGLPQPDPKKNARDAFDLWVPLVTTGQHDEAKSLCSNWLNERDVGQHSEAHKCLANIAIAEARLSTPPALEPGATNLRPLVSKAGVDLAVRHYESAIEATPLDTDAHLGRMDILILAARYREANDALEQTLSAFSSRSELNTWFKLLGRFQRLGAFEEGLAYLKIIEKHHPLDHRVHSNLGAYYAIIGDHDQAIAYSKRAVSLNPDDPINKWNLARMYDYRGDLQSADTVYQEALALFAGSDPQASCDYAEFLVDRLHDSDRACKYARSSCEPVFTARCLEIGRESG